MTTGLERALSYVQLGFRHILFGVDHLLFVLGLLLIVADRWMLVKTITSFTVAHSITLAIATLGYASAPMPPLNAAIALSILFLGPEIVRVWRGETSFTIRHPWVVAFAFGLLHGFGFASGLSAMGLPKAEIPLALLLFNVGVEIGQVAFVSHRARAGAGVQGAGGALAAVGRRAARVRRRLARRVLDHPAAGQACRGRPLMHPGWLLVAVGLAFTFLGPAPASAHLVNTNVGEFYAGMMHPLTGADHFLLALALALIASQCGKRAARVALLVFPLALLAGAAAGSRLPALSFLLPATQVLLVALGGLLALSDRLGPTAVGVTALATGSILGYRSGMDMAASGVAAQFIPGVALTGLILVALVAAWVPVADSPAGRTLRGLAGGAFAVAGVVLIVGFLEPSARGTRLPNQEDLLAMLKAGELSAPLWRASS